MPEQVDELAPVVRRNIDALDTRRQESDDARQAHARLADWISETVGSMRFVVVQLVLVVAWVLANRGLEFDPDFVGLATSAAVESIFLAAFVLISQNRMRALADERANLDLQVGLLAEHEITRLMRLLDAVAERLNVPAEHQHRQDIEPLVDEVEPEQVLEQMSQQDS
jgi:uncharacterized membrane protein